MSNDNHTAERLRASLAALPERYRDEERLAIYRSVIAPGVPDAIVALVYHYASDLGLDPVRKEVLAVQSKRKDNGRWVTDYNIIISVHAMLKLVGRQQDYCGLRSSCVYPGERCTIASDGTVQHEYDPVVRSAEANALPLGAWATVTRLMHGTERQFTVFTPFAQAAQTQDEYDEGGQRTGKVRLRSVWAKRPDWMTEKCAVAAAVRKAYDHVIGKVYLAEEFGALSTESGAIVVPDDTPLPGAVQTLLPPSNVRSVMVNGTTQPVAMADLRMQAYHGAVSRLTSEGLSSETAHNIQRGMLVGELGNLCDELNATVYKDRAREFTKTLDSGVWLVDTEVLLALKQPAPVLLSEQDAHFIISAMSAIEAAAERSKEQAHVQQ